MADELLKKQPIEAKLEINGKELKGTIASASNILKLTEENLSVTKDEIRLVNPNPNVPISILSIIISIKQPTKEEGGKKEVPGAKSQSFINCPVKDDVINCVYEAPQVPEVECPGMFERVDYDDDKLISCKMKCTDKIPGQPDTPDPEMKPEPEAAEMEAKEPAFPDQMWWLDYNENDKNAKTVITFENGDKFKLEGELVEEWGVEEGQVSGDNKSDPKTITLT